MPELRALLLTDVVDSTKLTEALGDAAMAAVWTAHDRAARDLLLPWRGREIDKTDGMLLMFEQADDAAGYALAYHAALARLPVPLRARAGLHLGPVVLRENSAEDIARGAKPLELDGLAKPTAARIMSLALGGQTLLSPEARAALGDAVLAGQRLQSAGHWLLKGLAEPIELFSLAPEGSDEPPLADTDKAQRMVRSGERWLPVREIPNNLPQALTSFVGRERERQELKELLRSARLVTLLGMGGLGKTRLSLELADELRHLYPDGVWFVDLSPIRDPALVAGEAAQAIGVREEPERPLTQTLCAHLRQRRVLIVLDNCEHLLEPAGDLVDAVLRAAPGVSVLASSREALGVPGEQSYPIQPLPLPQRGASVQDLSQSTAVRLFIDRAQAHRPDFSLDSQPADALAALVARLEGIPLAIELAAARLRTMEVDEILDGLTERYELLAGGSRRLQPRQQTLRGLVDWSYDMLDAAEQRTLQRLGPFVGGFDLAAVKAVCGAAPLNPGKAGTTLASLVEKSLVLRETHGRSTRFRMLETIRDYALEKLAESDEAAAAAARHAEHFFALAKEARAGLLGADQATWVRRVEADLDNLRAAISLALGGGVDPFIAVKMAVALQGFWILRGYASEGRAVVDAALLLPAVRDSEMAQAHALYVGAALAGSQGDHAQARAMLQTCLALRRGVGRPVDIAGTLSTLSLSLLQGGDVAGAIACEREALDLFRGIGDRIGEAIGLQHLGLCALAQSDDAQARTEFDASLAMARSVAHREVEAECELLLGELDFLHGELAPAREHFGRSLATCREAADQRGEANALRWLGKAELAEGRLDTAQQSLAQALQVYQDFEMRDELLGVLEDHAQLALALGDAATALKLAAAASHWRERLALPALPRHLQRWQAWLSTARAALPADAAAGAWQAGSSWELVEAERAARALPLPASAAPAQA